MKTNEALRGRYEKIAHRWNCTEYDGLRRDDLIPTILGYSDLTSLPQNPTILETMCGTGNIGKATKEFLEKQGGDPDLYFFDFSQAMLDQITILAKKILGDVRSMPFADSFFDRVFLRGGLHDLPKEYQLDAVKEIYRILKPNGLFILIVSYAQEEAQRYFNEIVHLRDTLAGNAGEMERYFATKKEYCDLLSAAAFKNLQNPIDYMGKISYSATIELDAEGGNKINTFFENLPENIKGLWVCQKEWKWFYVQLPLCHFNCQKINYAGGLTQKGQIMDKDDLKVLDAPAAVLEFIDKISIPSTSITRGRDYYEYSGNNEERRKIVGLNSLTIGYKDLIDQPRGESIIRRYKLCNKTSCFAILQALGGTLSSLLSFSTILYLMRIQKRGAGNYLVWKNGLSNIFFFEPYKNTVNIVYLYKYQYYDENLAGGGGNREFNEELIWDISGFKIHESIYGLGYLHEAGSYVFSTDVDLDTKNNRVRYELAIEKLRNEEKSKPTQSERITHDLGNGIVLFRAVYGENDAEVAAAIAEYKSKHPDLVITAITGKYLVNFEKR